QADHSVAAACARGQFQAAAPGRARGSTKGSGRRGACPSLQGEAACRTLEDARVHHDGFQVDPLLRTVCPCAARADVHGLDAGVRKLGRIRLYPAPALNLGYVHRGGSEQRMRPLTQRSLVMVVERADDAGHPRDRAVAQVPAAAVRGHTMRRQLEPDEALVSEDETALARLGNDTGIAAISLDEVVCARAGPLLVA